MAGPGYVRREPQALRVGGVQQRMAFGQRLGGEYIQSRARYPAFVDRFRQGDLVPNLLNVALGVRYRF